MGICAPTESAAPCEELVGYVNEVFSGRKADRIFMYNPDAVAQWIYEKYPRFTTEAKSHIEIELPFCTVLPCEQNKFSCYKTARHLKKINF